MILVSVIICTYQRPEMLSRAIDSVLSQTYKNIEIIICDDNSNDMTDLLVQDYINNYTIPIKYIKNNTNRGACYTRNQGIFNATGKFICGLDDDDEFTPDRIQVLLDEYSEGFSFITSNISVISKDKPIKSLFSGSRLVNYDQLLTANLLGNHGLIETDRLREIRGYDESLNSFQDYDLWVRLVKKFGPAKRVQASTYILHTEHEGMRITLSTKRKDGMLNFLNKHRVDMSKNQISLHQYYISIFGKSVFYKVKAIFSLSLGGVLLLIKGKFLK